MSHQVPHCGSPSRSQKAKGLHGFSPHRSDPLGHRAGRKRVAGLDRQREDLWDPALNWEHGETFAPLGLEIQRQRAACDRRDGGPFQGLGAGYLRHSSTCADQSGRLTSPSAPLRCGWGLSTRCSTRIKHRVSFVLCGHCLQSRKQLRRALQAQECSHHKLMPVLQIGHHFLFLCDICVCLSHCLKYKPRDGMFYAAPCARDLTQADILWDPNKHSLNLYVPVVLNRFQFNQHLLTLTYITYIYIKPLLPKYCVRSFSY